MIKYIFAALLAVIASAKAQDITYNGLANNFPNSRYCHVEIGAGSCSATIAWDKQSLENTYVPIIYAIVMTYSDQYTGEVWGGGWPGAVVWCDYRINGAGVGSQTWSLYRYPGYQRIYRFSFFAVKTVYNENNQQVPATCGNASPYAYFSADYIWLKEQDVIAW